MGIPQVKNQVDHRRLFYERLAAGKVQTSSKPADGTKPRPQPIKRPAVTDASGRPLSLAEQLGLLTKAEKAKRKKPKKRITVPVILTPDTPSTVAPARVPAAPVAPVEVVVPVEPAAVVVEPVVTASPAPPDTGFDLFKDIRQQEGE
jgi:hypothetical protein